MCVPPPLQIMGSGYFLVGGGSPPPPGRFSGVVLKTDTSPYFILRYMADACWWAEGRSKRATLRERERRYIINAWSRGMETRKRVWTAPKREKKNRRIIANTLAHGEVFCSRKNKVCAG